MDTDRRLRRHLSPLGAWAFSIGTSVGWGSLVVTANTYLVQAGPLGSALGLAVGALVMLVISWNYAYMLRRNPDAGGAYAYTREVFGYDPGFLTAWFLAMTYFAILWANATSLPLFGRIFLGGVFRVGRLYTLFGYDVYLGEALLSVAGILLGGLLCVRHEKVADGLMIVLALLFTSGIVICFGGALFKGGSMMDPAFVPDASALSQVVKIAVISPWAFIGFESISHGAEEISFEARRMRRVLLISVISTMALYILVTLTSVAAYPPQYANWLDYIRDLDNLQGIEALPAFYAANACLGRFGVSLLALSLLALVITSLIGNMTALSRVLYALAKDRILPQRYAQLNRRGAPERAVWLAAGVSCLIPLVGRTAIGWIVDVTTIGATLIYGFVSGATAVAARQDGNRRAQWMGRIGLGAMIFFGTYVLAPNLVSKGSLAKETYLLFIAWSVLGFLFFRSTLRRDRENRFGKSVIVWVALLSLVLFTALVWMRQSMIDANDAALFNIQEYYAQHEDVDGHRAEDSRFIADQMDQLERSNARTMLLATGMFAFALMVMMTNHSYMNRRSKESERLANIDPMTGVKSKHAYLVREGEMNARIASGEAPPFGVVVCDVNGLKKINDTLGHKAGDEYIRAACQMVCEIFRHSPVFRVGGDEFVAILTGRDYENRRGLMLALHQRSVDHISRGGAVISGGLSEYAAGEDLDVHTVFERADALMYEEKQLLKGLGAVTRDESPEEEAARQSDEPILNVRRKLLVVEDDTVERLLLGGALEEKYEVLYAEDGVDALTVLDAHREDLALVLLDLMMPRMDGRELLRRMKADAAMKGIPVIVLTSDQQSELECLKLGAADFIPKPYPDWEIVRARVDKCVELYVSRDIIQSTERDGLTRLFNVDYFLRYVKLFDQHYRDMAMDVVVVDVNRFHMVNERHGRQYGDDMLRRIGEKLRHIAREAGGVGCRRGADTFLLYCPHREDYPELLSGLTEAAAQGEEGAAGVRLRMGVYADADKSLDIERRFDRAQLAADTVRTGAAGQVGFYDENMHRLALFREHLLEDFRFAIEQERFQVFLQPKFDIRPEEPLLSSAEALVRWQHPELGLVSPGDFIPLLEENGLILELDRYVWQRTAAMIRGWKDRFGFSVPISVNVSRIDMLTPNLKGIFSDILKEYSLTTDDLMLEITESAYTDDSEQVISVARELRGMGMGFRIEMDDFGAGYSSLGMLSRLPIDALKLDMSFVQSTFEENRDVRMIELIIDIADYLGVPVVAEGVETEAQYQALRAMGCDLVQGFYFSRPVPGGEFDRFIQDRMGRGDANDPFVVRRDRGGIPVALNDDFESIFYIDLSSDFYLEFHTGQDGGVQLKPGSGSFFGAARDRLLADVAPEDAPGMAEVLTREHLAAWMAGEGDTSVAYRRVADGETTPMRMRTIKTRSRDEHHAVIGIRKE